MNRAEVLLGTKRKQKKAEPKICYGDVVCQFWQSTAGDVANSIV